MKHSTSLRLTIAAGKQQEAHAKKNALIKQAREEGATVAEIAAATSMSPSGVRHVLNPDGGRTPLGNLPGQEALWPEDAP